MLLESLGGDGTGRTRPRPVEATMIDAVTGAFSYSGAVIAAELLSLIHI